MNQQPQSAPPYLVDRGDEFSLIGLWKVLVNYKLLVAGLTILTTLGAIYYASTLPIIYKAEVLMIPVSSAGSASSSRLGGLASLAGFSLGGNTNEGGQAIARLKTRSYLTNHIKERNLKPILFANKWNGKEKQWIDEEPSNREAAELLLSMISTGFDPDNSGLTTFTLTWKNPSSVNKIADIANDLVSSINLHAKRRTILEAKNSILFLEKELESTNIINSQTILYNLIEQQMGKIMMANVRDDFIYTIIDSAVIPNDKEPSNKYLIIFFGSFVGLFFGLFAVILTINLKKIKESY